eukprot:g46473.t1
MDGTSMDWKARFQELEVAFEEYKEQTTAYENELSQALEQAQADEEMARKKNAVLKEKLDKTVTTLSSEVVEAQTRFQAQQKELSELKVKVRKLEQDKETLQRDARLHEAKIEQLQEQYEDAMEEKVMADTLLSEEQEASRALRQELTDAQGEILVLSTRQSSMKANSLSEKLLLLLLAIIPPFPPSLSVWLDQKMMRGVFLILHVLHAALMASIAAGAYVSYIFAAVNRVCCCPCFWRLHRGGSDHAAVASIASTSVLLVLATLTLDGLPSLQGVSVVPGWISALGWLCLCVAFISVGIGVSTHSLYLDAEYVPVLLLSMISCLWFCGYGFFRITSCFPCLKLKECSHLPNGYYLAPCDLDNNHDSPDPSLFPWSSSELGWRRLSFITADLYVRSRKGHTDQSSTHPHVSTRFSQVAAGDFEAQQIQGQVSLGSDYTAASILPYHLQTSQSSNGKRDMEHNLESGISSTDNGNNNLNASTTSDGLSPGKTLFHAPPIIPKNAADRRDSGADGGLDTPSKVRTSPSKQRSQRKKSGQSVNRRS